MTAMSVRERPIPFTGPNVVAILTGTKTQTRRVVKPQPFREWSIPPARLYEGYLNRFGCGRDKESIRCPYHVGDHLWVREKCIQFGHERTITPGQYQWPRFNDHEKGRRWFEANCDYAANLRYHDPMWDEPHGTLSSRFMPRWASRITLEVTEVRVQRVHQISDADVQAEGIDPIHIDKYRPFLDPRDVHSMAFGESWNEINGKRPGCDWASNPWVWAITFKRILP